MCSSMLYRKKLEITRRNSSPDRADIVATYQNGNYLVQQMCQQIRTPESFDDEKAMEFEEITQVQPWIDFAHDIQLDLDEDQAFEPEFSNLINPWNRSILGQSTSQPSRIPKMLRVRITISIERRSSEY